VYTPTLKKHQVVRDLKKFENHSLTVIAATQKRFEASSFSNNAWLQFKGKHCVPAASSRWITAASTKNSMPYV